MEAKDTVMNSNPYNSANTEAQAERLCWMAYEQGKSEQAQITWGKAKEYFLAQGRKEVMEWIEEHREDVDALEKWHSQLAVWRIKKAQ